MDKSNENTDKSLRRCVFDTIDEEHLKPRGKSWFMARQFLIWFIWGATIILGSVTVAVLLFIARYQQYAIFEVTHSSSLSFLVSVLPLAWVVVLLGAITLAYCEIRRTGRGYKYSFSKVLLGTSGIIIFVGVIFEFFSLGALIDSELGELSKMYHSQEVREQTMWQQPQEGRLVGVTTADAAFVDMSGIDWKISEEELQPAEVALLRSGREVKVYGTTTEDGVFVACGVMPTLAAAEDRSELRKSRENFAQKVDNYRGLARAELVAQNSTNQKPCRKLPVFN